MKLSAVAFLLVAIALKAPAQVSVGTLIVYWVRVDSVTVAAESRVTTGLKTYRDNQCKVFSLTDHFLFASSGISGEDQTLRSKGWEGEAIAATIWRRDPSASPETIARLWADAIIPLTINAIHVYPEVAQMLLAWNSQSLAGAMFAKQVDGGIAVAEVSIRWNPLLYQITGEVRAVPEVYTRQPGWLGFMGEIDIASELVTGNSARALAFRSKMENQFGGPFGVLSPPGDMTYILVEESTKLDITGRLGGAVDVAQLPATGSVKWLHRKKNCAAN